MKRSRRFRPGWMLFAGLTVASVALVAQTPNPPDFKADDVFTGSSLKGWRTVGAAEWSASAGTITGRPKAPEGGWLVMERPLQDLQFYANVRCEAACRAGVLLRAERTADGGLRGLFVSYAPGDFVSYVLTLDASGKEIARTRIGQPPTGAAATAAANATLKPGEWVPVRVNLWDVNLRPAPGAGGAVPADGPSYGPIALYVGGESAVAFKDVAWKNVNRVTQPLEVISPRFQMRQIASMYYGWSTAAADFNGDGAMDIASGPFYYLGPDFTERRIYRSDRVYNPATEYAPDMVNFAYDFTGDGAPDILASGWDRTRNTRPIDLYVNPRGADRRWDHFTVLPTPDTESVLMRDLDGDGRPEMVFGTASGYAWARPDPKNPIAPWPVRIISRPNDPRSVHGMGGVGDINGDGRADIVTNRGWYAQPADLNAEGPWEFHPYDFATATTEMGVYDVNGDGRTDVVASLSVHGWGLAWFEQRRSAGGAISFVRHEIAGDYSTPEKNTGGVVFSEAHGARFADMTGDGIPDFIVGKRYWSHLENYSGPDPYGPPVLYIYRTVRNPKAPGGAEFVPELVHNRSGVGSAFDVADLNKDGKPDIAVATAFGVHVFYLR